MKVKLLQICFVASVIYQATRVGSSGCKQGIELPDGTCDCYSCWKGKSCDEYASRPPKFSQGFDSVTLTQSHLEGKPVYKAEAVDPDEEFCRDPSGCPCSNMTYFIVSQDGGSNFIIDKYTGEVKVSGESNSLFSKYTITIGAGDDGLAYDTMSLTITAANSLDDLALSSNFKLDIGEGYSVDDQGTPLNIDPGVGEVPHHRHKRALTLPSNVTFTLTKIGLNQNITEIKIGHRIQFQLDILFPQGTTDMQVEIFTPDSDTIVMMLCNVNVEVGKNLNITGSSIPVLESLDNSTYNDRAIIALGTVTNNPIYTQDNKNSTITVTYEAVMVENPSTVNSREYWVSVGAEFNNENDVWVGQASFTANTTPDNANSFSSPQANITGPSTMAIGSSQIFNVDLILVHPVVDIKFDMFAPVNYTDVMSICDASISGVNDAYSCGFPNLNNITPTFLTEGNSVGNKRMTMSLGRPINKLAREYVLSPVSSYRGIISFTVYITLMDDTTLIGNDYWIGTTVEIGTTAIWAGQLKVTAVAKTASQPVSPTFNFTMKSGSTVSETKPGIIQIDITVPVASYADYLLEVVGPMQNGDAVFQMCGVKVIYGKNLGCASVNKIDPEYRISSNFSSHADIMRLNLGRITNIAVNDSTPASDNIVSVFVYLKVANSSLAAVGGSYDVSLGMLVGSTNLTIGQLPVLVSTSASADNITSQNTPDRNLTIGGRGSDTIPIGKTGKILLNIKTKRNTIYSPFNIEFIMPNATDRSLAKICKVQLQSVGLNNPCIVKESFEKTASLLSSFNSTNFDRAVVNMDSLCNVEVVDDEDEDMFVVAINFILLNDSQFYSDPKTYINGGIMFSSSNLWVVQLAINADLSSSAHTLSTTPYMTSVANNYNFNAIPLGFPAKFYIRMKIAPNDTTPLSLNVSTLNNALSICDIRLSRIGDSFPCLDEKNIFKTISGLDQLVGVNRLAYIDLGIFDNVGSDKFLQTSSFDSNTIEIELITKLTPDATIATNGSIHFVKVELKYGASSTQIININLTATTDTSLAAPYIMPSTSITGKVDVLSITGDNNTVSGEKLDTIVKSESKRLILSIETILNSTSQMTVTVSTPLNVQDTMEILYIGLMDTGKNVLCVTQAHTTATYKPRNITGTFNDIGELTLGYVCNTGTNKTDTTANRIRIESIVRLLETATSPVGTSLTMTFTVNSNNQSILVQTIPLIVGDDSSYTDVYLSNFTGTKGAYLNSTEDPVIAYISEYKTLPLVFNVIPFTSSKVTFNAIMPVNTSAIMTIKDVKFVRSGKNLPNMARTQNSFQVTTSSKFNTSQVTKYEALLGVISNGGQTYRFGSNNSDDDTFTVEVTFQMADHALATNNSIHKAIFGIHVANVVYILEVEIKVLRTGKETLLFNVTSQVNTTISTSSRIQMETTLALSNFSTAEGQNAVLNLFLPPYVSYVNTIILNTDKTILAITKANNTVAIEFDVLYFTDEIYLITILEPNYTYVVPLGISGVNTVLNYQPVANTNKDIDVAGEMNYVNFTIITTPDTGIPCSTAPLGLQSGAIKNCQLSSSDNSLAGHGADKGRLGNADGWSPFVSTGKVGEERYFQVYFGNETLVSKILFKQDTSAGKLKTLKLRYSDDGLAWIEYPNNDIFPSLQNSTQELIVPVPAKSRYIRLMITELDDNKKIGYFSFELIGCKTSSDKPADVCSDVVTPPTKLSDFSRRSFIKTSTDLYICDSIQKNQNIEQRCFSTPDDVTWIELDLRVGSLLGFESVESRVFAVSANGLHYMSSLNGIDWSTSIPSDVTKAKALATFKSAIKVPLDGTAALDTITPDPQFIDSVNYGATIDGVKKLSSSTWQLIFSWNTVDCCP